jgi:hypothetical protein
MKRKLMQTMRERDQGKRLTGRSPGLQASKTSSSTACVSSEPLFPLALEPQP